MTQIAGSVALDGALVRLRPFQRTDITDAYLSWMNDQVGSPFLLGARRPVSFRDLETYFERHQTDNGSFMFAVCDKSTGRHVGNARLYDVDLADRKAVYGWLIGAKDVRGKGYGTDALVQLLRFGFHFLNLHRVYGMVATENFPAVRSSERAGLVREGIMRESIFARDKFHDAVWFAMLRNEFDNLYGSVQQ